MIKLGECGYVYIGMHAGIYLNDLLKSIKS